MAWATPPFVPTGIQPENNVSSLKLNPEDGPKTYMGPYPVAEHYVVDFPITVQSDPWPETQKDRPLREVGPKAQLTEDQPLTKEPPCTI